ncbi:DUF637 domain-containing protein [Octadecabacter sp. G9-8]|uniref:DUF637 domain-containing protein n=1 Tax=Octadecabacter dasysiphoniae TaxID=2909341 RepID=A0ABS9CQC4_9RHOB|nr:DUF637 domain-containing protein [Octadecabacter dasysiphoniae]
MSSAVYGTDFGAGFVTAVTSSTVSLGLADIQSGIGDIFEDGANGGEGSLAHVTLHAVSGCLAAEAQGADCAAGAAGAMAQAIYAGTMDASGVTQEERSQLAANAELYGALASFLVSNGDGENVTVGAAIAISGFENNYLKHDEWTQYITALDRCGEDQSCRDMTNAAALETSLGNRHELLMCSTNGNCAELTAEIEYLNNPIAEASIQALQKLSYHDSVQYDRSGIQYGTESASSVIDLVSGSTEHLVYSEFYASSCSGFSASQCVVAFEQSVAEARNARDTENVAVVGAISVAILAAPFAGVVAEGAAIGVTVVGDAATKTYVVCVTSTVCTGGLTALAAADIVGVLRAYDGGDPSVLGAYYATLGPAAGLGTYADDFFDAFALARNIAPNGGLVNRFGPLNEGPLPDDIAITFRSGTYDEVITTEPTTLYRVIGDNGDPAGGYWTRAEPQGPVQSVIDSALDQNWGNSATTVVQMEVPAGTRLFEGVAAPQRGLVGGGNQIYFDRNINPLDPAWIQQ